MPDAPATAPLPEAAGKARIRLPGKPAAPADPVGSGPAPGPGTALALLLSWLAAMAAVTWFVLEPLRDALLPALMGSDRPGAAALARLALAAMGPFAWLLLATAALLGASLLLLEWRRAALSALVLHRGWPMLAALGGVALWLGHSYLGSGVLLSGDTIAHVSMLTNRLQAAALGQDPTWSNLKYLGLPLQPFYAPTTFWPWQQAAGLLGGPVAGLRLVLFAAHLLSALAAYALGRALGLDRRGAAFAAVIYAGCFAHLHLILYRGAIPQALSAALFPAAMLFVRRVAAAPRLRATDWAGLAGSAGLLLANYTPLAIVAGVHIAALGLASLALGVLPRRERAGRLAALAGAGAAAGCLAAGVLLPAALAGSEVLPLSIGKLLGMGLPQPGYFGQLLVWRAWRTNFVGGAAYLGLVPVGLAAWGAYAGLRRDAPPGRRVTATLIGLAALSTVLTGAHVRDIVLTVLYVALLAGVGAGAVLAAVQAAIPRRGKLLRSVPAFVLGVLLLDLGSTAIQPIGRTDKGWLDAAGEVLARERPSRRTLPLDVTDGSVMAVTGPSLLDWHGAEFVTGGHVEMATPAWIYAEEAGYLAEADLRRYGRLSGEINDFLCLLRIGRVVGIGRTGMGLPEGIEGGVDEGPPLGRTLPTDCPYQVVFAPALAPPPVPRFDPLLSYAPRYGAQVLPAFRAHLRSLLEAMRLDGHTGRAAVLLVPAAAPGGTAPAAAPSEASRPAEAGSPGVRTLSYAVGPARVEVTLEAPRAGFVRLAHAWHPRLEVRRDGRPVPAWPDVTGCIVVAVEAGRQSLVIEPQPAPGQRPGLLVSAAAAIALTGLALGSLLRRRT